MITVSSHLLNYADDMTSQGPILLKELLDETKTSQEGSGMLSGHAQSRFLKLLVQIMGAKKVLEIGTYTGHTALAMAEALPPEGRVVTLELNPNVVEFAQKYFNKSPHGHKIAVKVGVALESLALLNESFDFVFIDADKSNYPAYYEAALKLLRQGGLIAIDNTLWGGTVLHPEDDESKIIAEFNETLAGDDRVETVMLTVRDGLTLARKK